MRLTLNDLAHLVLHTRQAHHAGRLEFFDVLGRILFEDLVVEIHRLPQCRLVLDGPVEIRVLGLVEYVHLHQTALEFVFKQFIDFGPAEHFVLH